MKTILIVDDAAENIRLLKVILEGENYNVKVANSGKRCLEVVQKSPIPDLILLDIMMPEMDGYEVIEHLKADEKTKKIPVIFVTAKGEVNDETKGLELGAADFITKPINHMITLARVKTQLDLYEYNQSLERMVEEKTKEILQQKEQMFQQSKHAAMGEMVDAIAHQWQQPITILKLDADLLDMDFEDGRVDGEYVEKYQTSVHKQLDHMVNTLSEFRSFLRPDKKYEHFCAKSMFDRILLLLKDELIKNKIKVSVHEFNKVELYGVENEIIHLFINLINNAKDAFNEKEVQDREISVTIDTDEFRHIIKLSDNAGGIPQEIIGEIFKANVSTKKEEGKGSGIGLYMSTQIADKYGAKLDVENIQNGATFSFAVPHDTTQVNN